VGENPSLIVENIQQWLHKDYLTKAADAFAHAALAIRRSRRPRWTSPRRRCRSASARGST